MIMDNNRKILFFDIDGTILTTDTYEIPRSTKEAIRQARNNGHLTFINTGRTRGNIEEMIHKIGFDGYVCGCGTYIEVEGQVLMANTLSEDTCREVIRMLRKCKVDAVLEGREDLYFNLENEISEDMDIAKKGFAKFGLGIKKNWDTPGLVFDKLYTKSSEESSMEEFLEYVGEEFDYIGREDSYAEIVPKGYSKGSGIEYILKHYNLPLENAIVLGDSSNDISMFQYAKNCIAMGNSEKCILDIASFITKDIHEDGIAHALKHFCVI